MALTLLLILTPATKSEKAMTPNNSSCPQSKGSTQRPSHAGILVREQEVLAHAQSVSQTITERVRKAMDGTKPQKVLDDTLTYPILPSDPTVEMPALRVSDHH
jgi:hypothetical protein